MEIDERLLLFIVVFQKNMHGVKMDDLNEEFWERTTWAINIHSKTSFTVLEVSERLKQLENIYRAGKPVKYPRAYVELFGPRSAHPNLKILATAGAFVLGLGLLFFKAYPNRLKFVPGKAENQQKLENHDSLVDGSS